MLEWKNYLTEVKQRIGEISKINPDLVKGYVAISNAKTEHSVLDPKTRELIALAVAITTRCDGCIVAHTEAAKKHGATKEEIMEALGVSVAINTGTALIFSARVMDAYDNI
jgi:AhpD family alkylhydroperoxidase